MPRLGRLVAAVAVFALLAAAAGAIAGEPQVSPLTTAGPGGEVPAKVPVSLGWLLTNGDGQPAFHQDAEFEVRFENRTLLSTTPASGHDYDGVDPYQVAFPGPGNYSVTARVVDDSTGEQVDRAVTYGGTVTPAPEERLNVSLDLPERVGQGQTATIGAEVTGPGGEPVEHADVTFRVRRSLDGFEVFKTRTHDHDARHSISYVFDRSGSFEVLAVASPTPAEGAPRLAADAASAQIEVEAEPTSPAVSEPVDRPLENAREVGDEDEGYQLFGTYDPYTSVGPHGRIRLGMLTLNETTGTAAGNVDYRASLLGPDGEQLFHSDSLHAVDGFEYVTLSRPEVGTYTMRVDASKGSWSDHVTLEFTVLPPAAATNAGPLYATPNASTELDVGRPVALPIHVEDGAGVPLTHGEVDVRLARDDTGVTVAAGKLHAHENGTLPLTVAVGEAGGYRLELMPESLQPAPTPLTFGDETGRAPVFDLEAEGGFPGDEALDPQSETGQRGTPAPTIGMLLSVLALLAGLRARPNP